MWQACLKVNPETVIYPGLISLEVSEADVLSRAADEQASRVRPSDAAAAADRVRPEVHCTVFSLLTACIGEEKNIFWAYALPIWGSNMPNCKVRLLLGHWSFHPMSFLVLPKTQLQCSVSRQYLVIVCPQTWSLYLVPHWLLMSAECSWYRGSSMWEGRASPRILAGPWVGKSHFHMLRWTCNLCVF